MLDFDSLIFRTFTLFRKFPSFAQRYQTVYPYWCIDEFQDTNVAQYTLIKEMAKPSFTNIFVVADDDQIIFVGTAQAIDGLKSSDPISDNATPTPYELQVSSCDCCNCEQPDPIQFAQDAKQAAIAVGSSHRSSAKPISVLRFGTDDEECSAIAHRLSQFKPSERGSIAVLSRVNRLLDKLAEQLVNRGVDFVVPKKRSEFASAGFRWLHNVLRLAHRRSDEQVFESVVADLMHSQRSG